MKRWLVVLLAVVVAAGLLAPNPSEAQDDPFRVAFVYIGPVGDAGWTYSHDQARQYLEETMGDNIETTFIESVPEVDSKQVFDQLAAQGYDLVVGASFGYMDAMVEVSNRYPETSFLHASGFKSTENLAPYHAKAFEASYLAGIVAGHQTESDIIGYVGAHPFPVIIQDINALALGVQSVNPDAEVRVVWSDSWYDPASEREAAMSLIDVGADVIAQYQDSPAAIQAAEERGVYGIGFHSDMRHYAEDAYLTGPAWNWGPFFERTIREIQEGTWDSEFYWAGLEEGMVELTPLADFVVEEAREDVEVAREEIVEGSRHPYEGPIRDQDGTLRVEEGEVLSDDAIWEIDWFVENVNGTIPE